MNEKKVFSNSILYTINGLIQNCFSFIMLPLYTAYLTTNDYGITSLAENFISVMSYMCAFSMYTAVTRFYVEYKDDKNKLKRFYGTVSLFVFLSALTYFLLFLVFRQQLSKYIFAGVSFYPIVFVCLIEMLFHCQRVIYESILQSQHKALKFSIVSFSLFLVKIILTVYFVVFRKMGALGVILAAAVHVVLFYIVFLTDMILGKAIHFCIDKQLLKTTLKYSVPIMPHNLSTHIATLFSKIVIGSSVSLGAVGVFSIATKFGDVSDVVQSYVNNAYGPWLYEKLHDRDEDYKATIRDVAGLLTSVIGLFCIGLALFSQEVIVLLIDKSYNEAWKFIPFIVGVYVIKITYYFYVNILFYFKEASKWLFSATLSSSIINVVLSALIIPKYGVYGSIFADAVSMLIRITIVVFISTKFERIGLKITDFIKKEILIVFFIFAGMILSITKYSGTFSWVNVGYKVGICLMYVAYSLFENRNSLRIFMGYIKKKK